MNTFPARRHLLLLCLLLLCLLLAGAAGFRFASSNRHEKGVPLSKEKELKVTINAGFSDIFLSRGNSSEILHAVIDADLKDELDNYIEYSSRDRVGYLNINTSEEERGRDTERKHSFHINSFGTSSW